MVNLAQDLNDGELHRLLFPTADYLIMVPGCHFEMQPQDENNGGEQSCKKPPQVPVGLPMMTLMTTHNSGIKLRN